MSKCQLYKNADSAFTEFLNTIIHNSTNLQKVDPRARWTG